MTEDKRLHAEGALRLYAALETTPYIDAETDAKLDLFVCDLLSDADKSAFAERIRKDPILATEVQLRKADVDTHLNPEQLNEITGNVLDAISVFRPGWERPTWLLTAAAFVVLIGIAAVIVNRGERSRESQSLTLSNVPSGATISTTGLPTPAIQQSPAPSSARLDAVIATDMLPTPALELSSARNNTPFDATIAMTKLPTPAAHASPAHSNEPNLADVMALLLSGAIPGSEFNDVPNAKSDAAAIEMIERRGMIARMYRSEIAKAHTQDRARMYSVIGVGDNDTLNVRSRPSERSSIVARLRNGTSGIQTHQRAVRNRGNDWVQITAAGVKGWVRPKYLSSTGHIETVDERRRRLAGRLGIALALKFGTRPAVGDDSSANFMKVLGSWSADVLIESTVNEAFPDQPLVRQQVLIATKALFEGDLTLIAAGEQNQKQELTDWLQRRSPSAAQNAEVIDFLYEVYQRGHSS